MRQFIAMVILALLAGCSAKPLIVHHVEKFTGTGENELYVVSHGWHTGIVVPAATIQQQIPELKARFGDTPYIEIGWGDKGFYQAEEITSGLTLRAILWPTESVIHSVAVPQRPVEFFSDSDVKKICLSNGELESLIRFISSSFYKDGAGNVLALKNGLYGNSQFYRGVGDYYLMNTCNKWTAKGLKSAGMDISPTFKLTASSVMRYLSPLNMTVKECGRDGLATAQFKLP